MARSRANNQHVRMYRHEMQTEAWRTMSCYGRALLIEMRALFKGDENRVYMSLREIMDRLNVGRKAAEKARDDLLERGWIRLVQPASFTRKVRHAPVYMLTNEPPDNRDGSVAPKDYMRWQKFTVYLGSTDGVPQEHRDPSRGAQKGPHGVPQEHRQGKKPRSTVYLGSTQLSYQGVSKQ